MTSIEPTRVRIIGCGRWLRRDDQVGLLVARELEEQTPAGVAVLTTESPAADIPANLDDADLLIVVDAARADAHFPAGAWRRIDYRREPGRIGEHGPALDVHQLSVDVALKLAEQLGILPPDVWVYAVAAEDCTPGEVMTPGVEAAVKELAPQILADLDEWRRHDSPRRTRRG